jgi:uncharacterized HAD superfamily protein
LYIGRKFFPGTVQKWAMTQKLQNDIEVARDYSNNHKISIITARPNFMHEYTEDWLRDVAQIHFDNLYCVGLRPGFGARKLEVAKKIKLDMFLDDTESTIQTFKKAGIQAQLFQSWAEVEIPDDLKSN